jgi:hypothetical protein
LPARELAVWRLAAKKSFQDTLPFAGSHGGDCLGIFVQYFVVAPINLIIIERIAAESGGGI